MSSVLSLGVLRRFTLAGLVFGCVTLPGFGDQQAVHPEQSCYLCEDLVTFDLVVAAPAGERVHVDYRLASGQRTIARGTADLRAEAIDGENYIRLPINLSEVQLKTIVTLQFEATLTANDQRSELSKIIHLYPVDPQIPLEFSYEEMGIHLYDPQGDTAKLLADSRIPHVRLRSLGAVESITKDVLVIGQGVSFKKQRSLSETIVSAARRGVPVLCLAPAGGTLQVDVTDQGDRLSPAEFVVGDGNWPHRYDKRLDLLPTPFGFSLQSDGERLEFTFQEDPDAQIWNGSNLVFTRDGDFKPGKIEVSCSPLLENWQTSPVPRYTLAYCLLRLHSPAEIDESHDQ